MESTRSLLEERKHTLSLTLPNDALRVEGDAIRLSQVVLNLILNASDAMRELSAAAAGLTVPPARETLLDYIEDA